MSGWSLPFSERYNALWHELRDLPREIRHHQEQAEAHRIAAKDKRRRLVRTWQAWCQLQVRDADEIGALLAHREAVHAALKDAGWFKAVDERPGGE